jgi:hypothetical protein
VRATLQLRRRAQASRSAAGATCCSCLEHPRLRLAQMRSASSLAEVGRDARGCQARVRAGRRAAESWRRVGEGQQASANAVGDRARASCEKLGFGRAFPLVALFNARGAAALRARRAVARARAGPSSRSCSSKELPAPAKKRAKELGRVRLAKQPSEEAPEAARPRQLHCQEAAKPKAAKPEPDQHAAQEALSRGCGLACASRAPYRAESAWHLGQRASRGEADVAAASSAGGGTSGE